MAFSLRRLLGRARGGDVATANPGELPELEYAGGGVYMVRWPSSAQAYSPNSFQKDEQPLEPFKAMESSSVYSAVSIISQDVSRSRIRHLEENPRDGSVEPLRSDLWRTLRRPNSYQSRGDYWLSFMMNILLDGNSYAYAPRDRNGRHSNGIHIRPSTAMQPQIDPDTGAIFYRMTIFEADPLRALFPNDRTVTVPARDVIHARIFCYEHPLLGMSPLRAATFPVFHGRNIQKQQTELFSRRATPDGIISVKGSLPKGYAEKLRDAWQAQYSPGGDGGIAVIPGDASWHPTMISAGDAQLVEQYRTAVFDVARIYRIPSHMIGLTEQGGPQFNNAETLSRLYYNQCLGFWFEHIEACLDHQFNLPPEQLLEFDFEASLMRTDFEARVKAATGAVQGGIFTPNEARRRWRLPRHELGDELYMQRQMQPIGTPPEPAPAPGGGDDAATEELEDQVANLTRERLELSSDLGSAHQRIRALELELEAAAGGASS